MAPTGEGSEKLVYLQIAVKVSENMKSSKLLKLFSPPLRDLKSSPARIGFVSESQGWGVGETTEIKRFPT